MSEYDPQWPQCPSCGSGNLSVSEQWSRESEYTTNIVTKIVTSCNKCPVDDWRISVAPQ